MCQKNYGVIHKVKCHKYLFLIIGIIMATPKTSQLVIDIQASLVNDVLDMHVVEKVTKNRVTLNYKGYKTGSVLVPANTIDMVLGTAAAFVATSSAAVGFALSSMTSPVNSTLFSYSGVSVGISLTNTTNADIVVDYILADTLVV
jgi:hypothetical protein